MATTITLPIKCSTVKDIWLAVQLVVVFALLWAGISTAVMLFAIVPLALGYMIEPSLPVVFGVGFVLTMAVFVWVSLDIKIACIKDDEVQP